MPDKPRGRAHRHTPGPWSMYGEDPEVLIGNLESKNPCACDGVRQVAVICQEDHEIPDYAEAHANARLIAACPELLESVKTMAAYYRGEIELNGTAILMMLERAIAKAEGRP